MFPNAGLTSNHRKMISGISTASSAKLGKEGNATTAVLLKICNALDCGLSDIMEPVKEPDETEYVFLHEEQEATANEKLQTTISHNG